MAGTYNFHRDLKKSEEKTTELLAALRLIGYNVGETCNDHRFDVILSKGGVELKCEIKHDFMSQRTGNFVVEAECRGRPSGISSTEASHWIFVTRDGVFLVPVESIQREIAGKTYKKFVEGGDSGSRTKMYVFALEILQKIGEKINVALPQEKSDAA